MKGSVPTDCPPDIRSQMQVEVLGFPTASVGHGYTPDLLPLGLDYLLAQLTELRETLSFTSLLKGTDEQPDEELHGVSSGRVLDSGASVPVELGCITSWSRDVFTTQEVL